MNLSSLPVFTGQIGGKYRGQFWLKKYLKERLTPQSGHRLKYRGVEYIGAVYSRSDKTSGTVGSKLTFQPIYSPQATLSTSKASVQPSRKQLR